jgi:hypothetical protein
MFLTYAVFAIVILTSVWAGFDSHRLQISSSKKPYTWNNGFLAWLVCCLMIWIIAFPAYLFKRAKTLRERGESSARGVSLVGGAVVIVAILCIAAPFLGWVRMSEEELRTEVSASIEQTWRSNKRTANIRLKNLSLVHQDGDNYRGVVVADVAGVEEQHALEVTYDGVNLGWKIQ